LKIQFSGLDSLIKFNFTNTKFKNYNNVIVSEMLKKGFLANDTIYVSVSNSENLIKKYVKKIE